MVMLWVRRDWPMHDISEEYLYSAHMLQHMMLSYFLPPLGADGHPDVAAAGAARRRSAVCVLDAALPSRWSPVCCSTPMVMIIHIPTGREHLGRQRAAALRPARPGRDVVAADVDAGVRAVPRVPDGPRSGNASTSSCSRWCRRCPAAWLTFAEGAVYHAYDIQYRLWGISVTARPAAGRRDHEDRRRALPVVDRDLHVLQAIRRWLQVRATTSRRIPPRSRRTTTSRSPPPTSSASSPPRRPRGRPARANSSASTPRVDR